MDDNFFKITEDFEFEEERGNTPISVHMTAGSIAGLMEHVAIFPLDTIKVNKIFLISRLIYKPLVQEQPFQPLFTIYIKMVVLCDFGKGHQS
jgi:hypothetical protein